MSCATLNKETYSKVEKWNNFYSSGKNLHSILYDPSWTILFAQLKKNPKFDKIDEKIKKLIDKNKHIKIYPLPSYVFKAFSMTPANELKVVFIGQDPYFNCEYYDKCHVPQAMGLSFSVPHDINIPSSLGNIYKNMVKYDHLKKIPITGNLWYWTVQGCLMLNAALTVEDGSKKSHTNYWEWFTNHVIQYISDNMEGIIFVLWGADAYKKIHLIDLDRHYTTISSHPSGLSANKPFRNYPSFMEADHFGQINSILKKTGRTEILWD